MKEIKEEVVLKILSKIYRDTIVYQSSEYFISHVYKASHFKDLVEPDIFHNIISFLPNSKYKGIPFILSVIYNKRTEDYEITVHNPTVKY